MYNLIRKWFFIISGTVLTLIGLATIWTPIPIGIPLLLIGIPLLMRYSPNGRKLILKLAVKIPHLKKALSKIQPSTTT